jgi:hypothetical protein
MLDSIGDEFDGCNLGDPRREKRLESIADALHRQPQAGLPCAMRGEAELEGLYRFLNNGHVDPQSVLSGHIRKTVERIGSKPVVVVHDTTEFDFTMRDEIAGLGRLRAPYTQGFFTHYAIAVSGEETREPLGILHLQPWQRLDRPHPKRREWRLTESERDRWWQAVDATAAHLGARDQQAIHVMDREADSYQVAHMLARKGHRFVIRASHRGRIARADGPKQPLHRLIAAGARGVCRRDLRLTRRKRQEATGRHKVHSLCASYQTTLRFNAMRVEIVASERVRGLPDLAKTLSLNVVHVCEDNAPAGLEPIEWYLFTREPIDSEEEVLRVVDVYRKRWMIEEFFKAIKSGCAFEKRQLKSPHALFVALSIYSVIAWNLLRLRTLSELDVAAKQILRPSQLSVLNAARKLNKLPPLSLNATANDAMSAIAKLGGHIKNNGPPGWLVLGRGYQDLLMMEIGWLLHGVG